MMLHRFEWIHSKHEEFVCEDDLVCKPFVDMPLLKSLPNSLGNCLFLDTHELVVRKNLDKEVYNFSFLSLISKKFSNMICFWLHFFSTNQSPKFYSFEQCLYFEFSQYEIFSLKLLNNSILWAHNLWTIQGPLQSWMKSMQEENRLAKKQYTQIVTKGKRGEVRIANNNGLYVVFPKINLNTSMWIHQKPKNGHFNKRQN